MKYFDRMRRRFFGYIGYFFFIRLVESRTRVVQLEHENDVMFKALKNIYPFLYYERKCVEGGRAPALPSLGYGSMAWFTVIEMVEDVLRAGGVDIDALVDDVSKP